MKLRVLLHGCSVFITYIITVELTLMQSINQSITNPPCHVGIKIIFKWCEQTNCLHKCTCLSNQEVCKQICVQPHCGLLNCTSTKNCFQSVLFHNDIGRPNVKKITSCSPSIQQDCSRGKCGLMAAYKYEGKYTRAFQSCSEGSCKHLYSEADYTNQFCGRCNKMTCAGKHAKNCTQLCVLNKCKNMYCDAKHCTQVCFKNSKCNLTCGPNVESCDQTCSHGSNCVMNCNAKVCRQTCNKGKMCIRRGKLTTRVPIVTQMVTTTNLSTEVPGKNNGSTEVSVNITGSTEVSGNKTGSTELSGNKTGSTELSGNKTGSTELSVNKTGSTEVSVKAILRVLSTYYVGTASTPIGIKQTNAVYTGTPMGIKQTNIVYKGTPMGIKPTNNVYNLTTLKTLTITSDTHTLYHVSRSHITHKITRSTSLTSPMTKASIPNRLEDIGTVNSTSNMITSLHSKPTSKEIEENDIEVQHLDIPSSCSRCHSTIYMSIYFVIICLFM